MGRIAIGLAVAMAAAGFVMAADQEAPAVPAAPAAEGAKKVMKCTEVFVCDACKTVAMEAGKCAKCGKDLAAKRLLGLRLKAGEALVCACSGGCKCHFKPGDDKQCSCGKDIEKLDIKGKFVCPKCRLIKNEAGPCGCGKNLEEVK